MSIGTAGITVTAALVLGAGMAGLLLAQDGTPSAAGPSVSGELAFSDAILFDYDRDGKQERVQFWIEFEARPAPGETSPEVESGSLTYYVFDLESGQRVDDWLLGFNMTMGGDFPRASESYPLTNVRIDGKKAQFDLAGTSFTILDRGDSWEDDSIQVRDHNGQRDARFYGGDVRVVPDPLALAEPVTIAANRECNKCHNDAAVTIAVGGGPHAEFACADCHTQHPPDVKGTVVPACLECHESHSEAMNETTCVECHAGHDVAKAVHTATMPDSYCAPCHAGVVETLRASRSLHMGVQCVLCHRKEHGGPATSCTFCHRRTHPEHVMQNEEICASCHGTAHDIHSGRAE
jgi:hypothetical protein